MDSCFSYSGSDSEKATCRQTGLDIYPRGVYNAAGEDTPGRYAEETILPHQSGKPTAWAAGGVGPYEHGAGTQTDRSGRTV